MSPTCERSREAAFCDQAIATSADHSHDELRLAATDTSVELVSDRTSTRLGVPGDGDGAVVQEFCGGELVRVVNDYEFFAPHDRARRPGSARRRPSRFRYFNRLPDGTEVDLTRGQFARWEPGETPSVRTREYVLSNEATARRYRLLASRVRLHLSGRTIDALPADVADAYRP